ncbi:MAG TPA: DUF6265 family protein [Rhizomicrobium sp.]|nr:DUF6265 family protein [Rhizomicrobium sp.]
MKNSYLISLIAALALAGSTSASHAAGCTLAGLGWMVGDWQNASDPERAQERWVVAPGDVLMGSAWEFPKGQTGYAEVMTVKQVGDATTMALRHFDGGLSRAWEERDAAMMFAASACDGQSAVFDGQGDHAGEHLTYKRSGDRLLITGDFLHHGTPDHEEWQMVRAAADRR